MSLPINHPHPQDSNTHSSTSTSTSTSTSSLWYNQSKAMIPILSTWEQHVPPILSVLLHGTISSTSPLRMLRGQTSTILHMIWEWYLSYCDHWDDENTAFFQLQPNHSRCTTRQQYIHFPQPHRIQINMMPIRHSYYNTIPEEISDYIPMIRACFQASPHEYDKICYLTIDECMMKKGECHRRSDIHVEAPGLIEMNDSRTHKRTQHFSWARGDVGVDFVHGGLFMCTNIAATCAIWPYRVTNDYIKGRYGSLQHMKYHITLGEATLCKANTIYWLTDATPHVSLPMPHDGYRQFFRLVTSAVTWYADHSTPNPLGIAPDHDAMIIGGNKFV